MLLFIVFLVCIQPPLPGKEIEKGKRKRRRLENPGRKRDVFSLTAMRAGASMLLLYLLKGSISGIGKVVAMSSICGKSLVEMQRGVAYNRPIAKT
ncbi:hypothetical protein H5410_046070 [Solanum commersonii]|uniref:Uncharacterized protein n=1 Tax=Solanum commersonii TaxID=4109 RepID=A0A9J5XEI4_SOLCO|nr:hypothetical protein H5410_046070 [Solanum commersonii]